MYIKAPPDIKKNFLLIIPVDWRPFLKNPNPRKINSDNKNIKATIPVIEVKTRLSLIKSSPDVEG